MIVKTRPNRQDLTLVNRRASIKRFDKFQHQLIRQNEQTTELKGKLKAAESQIAALWSALRRLQGL